MNMLKTLSIALLGIGIPAGQALAVSGEYWEVTQKTEMKGMPFAMPETSNKVCVAENSDPASTVTDKDCEVLDSKTSGNRVTWKIRCVKKGEEMTGTGEITSSPGSYKGTLHMTGRMEGEKVDMTTNFSGKKVGGACDADAPRKEAAKLKAQADAQVASSCDPAKSENSSQLIMAAGMYFGGAKPLCADRGKDYCSRVSQDVSKKPEAFETLMKLQKDPKASGGVDVAKSCSIDVPKAQASVCKGNSDGKLDFLDKYCPAEAKAKRDREAAARSFTPAKSANPADNLIDNAKKLKGLFGL